MANIEPEQHDRELQNMEHPISKFKKWWQAALNDSPLKQKSAVCVSTIDQDGFPSGRFVDLKTVDEEGFTFCSYLDSEKGVHISANPKVALTLWWDHVGYQVRVKGVAEPISEEEAISHWRTRSREAQLTTLCSRQSQELKSSEALHEQLAEAETRYQGTEVPKPANWGGFRIRPDSIEFLTFSDDRLHKRELYDREDAGTWRMKLLQP
ncbi:MAG: pyridoxamine 5'-phosphate oxidase [Natronospirillum sp.]|uniref:pyridoxamine 5'-phosphate oxidase n=1 Tax=Natronospirillum sp. TaxID=2812955 RepID=UPI0025DC8F1E|nr:pyridoxamine 5'-phosphate oxidase [Natronospirillum sp.]MCH8552184.1 pyridoxamine 5'-phosphate oxidase [Natronospirillum sp.]